MLESGVAIQKAFDLAVDKAGDSRCRQAMANVAEAIRRGEDVTAALQAERGAFPDLVIDMVDVAEQTGTLPEILRSVADHYENLLRLRKHFLAQIAWPMFQLVAAILVIALVLVILGWIAETRGGEPLQILPFGLTGTSGAVIWLTCTFGTMFAVFVGYQIMRRTLEGQKFLDPLLMQIPVLGGCMRSFAIARFSWAYALTQQAGMPIGPSLQASFRATSNGGFLAAAPNVCAVVMAGEPLHRALSQSRLFPAEYLHMVEVAEESGTVPEMLKRLSPRFEEEARRSLAALTAALAWGIWGIVAVFIVFIIFNIFLTYIRMIYEFMPQ